MNVLTAWMAFIFASVTTLWAFIEFQPIVFFFGLAWMYASIREAHRQPTYILDDGELKLIHRSFSDRLF